MAIHATLIMPRFHSSKWLSRITYHEMMKKAKKEKECRKFSENTYNTRYLFGRRTKTTTIMQRIQRRSFK